MRRLYAPSAKNNPGVAPVALATVLCLALSILGWRDWTIPQTLSTPSAPATIASPLPIADPPSCLADPAHLPVAVDTNGQVLDYWHTCGTQIVDPLGEPVRVTGVAWSGMELPGDAPQGLNRRSYHDILGEVKSLGYDVIRIPFSSQAIEPGDYPRGIDSRLNPDLVGLTGLEVLDRIVAECHRLGLKVILDHHRISPWSVPPLWHDGSYSSDQWVADWVRLAKRYADNDAVIGMDLQNEPYGATWGTGDPATDWRLAATRAGNAILQVNPRVLIFVQGIGTYGKNPTYWWGGELQGASVAPMTLDLPGRLVYSPHEYGPSVYQEDWFSVPDYPSNLPAVWNQHWGFILQRQLAPVVVGETGAPQTGYDVSGTWQRTFLSYMAANHVGFIIWALNPNTTDTGSVFQADWQTVNTARQDLYAPYLN